MLHVKFAADKTQATVISRSREDVRQLQPQYRFGNDAITRQDSINTLVVRVDEESCASTVPRGGGEKGFYESDVTSTASPEAPPGSWRPGDCL